MLNIDFIVDANVIFSALISGKSIYKRLFKHYKFFTVDELFLEIDDHKETILAKTVLDSAQKLSYGIDLFNDMGVFPAIFLPDEATTKAVALCQKVDIDDFLYIALAIAVDKPLITRDVKLYNGLRKQKFKNIVLLQDLLETL